MRVASRAGARTARSVVRPAQRGYAASRRAYDARRRQLISPVVKAELEAYKRLVRGDPCSYCMGHCGQMAADHIVPLDAGGEHAASNLTAAGRPCNAAKREKKLLLFLAERT